MDARETSDFFKRLLIISGPNRNPPPVSVLNQRLIYPVFVDFKSEIVLTVSRPIISRFVSPVRNVGDVNYSADPLNRHVSPLRSNGHQPRNISHCPRLTRIPLRVQHAAFYSVQRLNLIVKNRFANVYHFAPSISVGDV